jgi:hypothetical protein
MVFAVALITPAPPWVSTNLQHSTKKSSIIILQLLVLKLFNQQNTNSLMLTAIQGAKAYWIPVALTSSAVASPIFLTSSGSL